MLAQVLGQQLDVVLGAPDVVAGLVVARLGQRGHGVDGDILDRRHLARAPLDFLFQIVVLVAQEIGRVLDSSWVRTRASTTGGLIGLVM